MPEPDLKLNFVIQIYNLNPIGYKSGDFPNL
jgi:hypothetical protein